MGTPSPHAFPVIPKEDFSQKVVKYTVRQPTPKGLIPYVKIIVVL